MKDYKKYFKMTAEPEDVYSALTNPFTIELWSGYPAKMSAEPGERFEMWDGDITGTILAVEPNKMIQQQWDFETQEEASVVTIKIHPDKNGKVSVELRHSNIPDEAYDNIVEGWEAYYMGAITEFYEEG